MHIIIIQGKVLGVASFTTGFVPRKPAPKKMSEIDVLSRALWLERHGQTEEADFLLDRWCKGENIYCI